MTTTKGRNIYMASYNWGFFFLVKFLKGRIFKYISKWKIL